MFEDIEILQSINPHGCGIRDLAKNLHHSPTSIIKGLSRMEEQGLITFQDQLSGNRGRPKKTPEITGLGKEYLKSFNEMRFKMLKARKSDFEKVRKDLELTERMINRGRKPDELFAALRDVVISIKSSQ